jgi:hypothetical protein
MLGPSTSQELVASVFLEYIRQQDLKAYRLMCALGSFFLLKSLKKCILIPVKNNIFSKGERVKTREAYKTLFEDIEPNKRMRKNPFRIAFDMPEIPYKKFKILAIAKGETIQRLALEAIEEKIEREIEKIP